MFVFYRVFSKFLGDFNTLMQSQFSVNLNEVDLNLIRDEFNQTKLCASSKAFKWYNKSIKYLCILIYSYNLATS